MLPPALPFAFSVCCYSMYPEVRFALVALALLVAGVAGFFAQRSGAANLRVLRSWTPAEATIVAMPARDHVEVELGAGPDARRIVISPPHGLGLSLFKKVRVYVDPADPNRVQFGGLPQMWLWASALGIVCVTLAILSVSIAQLGHGEAGEGWRFGAPPALMDTDIRLHAPRFDTKPPLFWSLLGLAAIASAVLARAAGTIPRVGLGAVGVVFLLLVWGFVLEVRWEQIARFERRELIPETRWRPYLGYDLPFPGRTTESHVFADKYGLPLVRLSIDMQPASSMRRLFDLCGERTGLRETLRTIRIPDL